MLWINTLLIIVLLVPADATADYLEVRRNTSLKAQPKSNAAVIEQVAEGDSLPLLNDGQQENGYYNVKPSLPGQTAWIYRSLVRHWYGEIPMPVQDDDSLSPLRDVSLNLTPEQERFARRQLRLGKPQLVYERVREGYVTAQDGRLKIPLWVQYEISPEELNGPVSRTDNFQPDTSVRFGFRAELADYSDSDYDRGHMVPAEDINRSQRTMDESFLLTNMAPQVGVGFNQHMWRDLEAAIRGWVAQRGPLPIITGPIFAVAEGRVSYKVIGKDNIAVPTHFYKIVVDANSTGHIEALAFVIPNQNLTGHHYGECLNSIDEIETATALDFLSSLTLDEQQKVESTRVEHI